MLDTFALAAAAIPRRNSDNEPLSTIDRKRAEQFGFAGDEPAFATRQAGTEVFSPPGGDETEQKGVPMTLTAAACAQTPMVQSAIGRQSGTETPAAEGDLVTREVAAQPILDVRAVAVSPENGADSDPLPPPSLPPIGVFVIGSGADEELSGTAMADFIDGRGGDDVLKGGYGHDLLLGGDGNDALRGGRGADELHGGAGDDEILGGPGADIGIGEDGNDALLGGYGKDVLFGGDGNDELHGGAGNDELHGGDGADQLFGGNGADDFFGGIGIDYLQGNGGRDALRGGFGDDQLFGGKGRDDLRGGLGDDLLAGGPGRDSLTGGPGRDTFRTDEVNHGLDQIRDFEAGVGRDVLDLHNVLDFELGDSINDFVQLIETRNSTKVAVNVDGFRDDFTVIFNLVGQVGLELDALVNDGNLQLTEAPSS